MKPLSPHTAWRAAPSPRLWADLTALNQPATYLGAGLGTKTGQETHPPSLLRPLPVPCHLDQAFCQEAQAPDGVGGGCGTPHLPHAVPALGLTTPPAGQALLAQCGAGTEVGGH